MLYLLFINFIQLDYFVLVNGRLCLRDLQLMSCRLIRLMMLYELKIPLVERLFEFLDLLLQGFDHGLALLELVVHRK